MTPGDLWHVQVPPRSLIRDSSGLINAWVAGRIAHLLRTAPCNWEFHVGVLPPWPEHPPLPPGDRDSPKNEEIMQLKCKDMTLSDMSKYEVALLY